MANLNNLDDLSSVAMTCEALATKIESITPAMKKVREKYPELSSENPPDEMKTLMDENKDLTIETQQQAYGVDETCKQTF